MVFEKIKELVLEQFPEFPEDEVTMNTSFREDLEADSLDLVEFIMAVEDEFSIDMEGEDADEEIANIKTIGDVVNYISDHQ